MSIHQHVDKQAVGEIRNILEQAEFELFPQGDGSMAFNFPISMTETAEDIFVKVLGISLDGIDQWRFTKNI